MKKHKTILLPLRRQFSIILVLFIVCTAGITLYNTQDYVRVQTDFLSSSLDSYSSQLAKNTLEAGLFCAFSYIMPVLPVLCF